MEIWEERITGRHGAFESQPSFEEFQMYLHDIPKPRNLNDLTYLLIHDELPNKGIKINKNKRFRRKLNKIKAKACNYEWKQRAFLYDRYMQQKEADNLLRLKIEGRRHFIDSQLRIAEQRVNAVNQVLSDLMELKPAITDKDTPDKDKWIVHLNNAISENNKAYSNAVKSINEILQDNNVQFNTYNATEINTQYNQAVTQFNNVIDDKMLDEIIVEGEEVREKIKTEKEEEKNNKK